MNTFSGLSLVLDRAAERRDEVEWVAARANSSQARFLVLDAEQQALAITDGDALRWLDAAERESLLPELPASLLGITEQNTFFLLHAGARGDAVASALGARRIPLREAGLRLPAHEAGLFAYAKGLAHWQREMRHCHACGGALQLVASGHRAQCMACGKLHFPRTDAAVIVIVEHDGACLLGRQANWPQGRYSTLAGFVEPGESLEDAVRREVAEEAGVRVDQVHYHSSQPWPLPASLMVGFTATAHDRAIQLRDGELEEARWFTPAQIAEGLADGSFATPPKLSVSYRLLAHWLSERGGLDLDSLIARQR
ncbi:NAD(+) diphosphatase [Dyella ginsengisoli]|uniref:NAD(+) diphosphatase n=1 Tax=Dyella ginsengisoli TaxID=363848 RepID=UPI00034983DF|nr:NAD(+) diphosphatase [Dyella ginsengisoli]